MRHEFVKETVYTFKCQQCGRVWSEYFQEHWKVTCPDCGNKDGADQAKSMDCWMHPNVPEITGWQTGETKHD